MGHSQQQNWGCLANESARSFTKIVTPKIGMLVELSDCPRGMVVISVKRRCPLTKGEGNPHFSQLFWDIIG